ncbi:glycerophosphodiester phosphodiesterase family protein [Shimia abyssi]|uniref:Glycerophosphoryl diester phosphodiesterase n=1 Tax=Shimia abyssi TaxID=1662395 RepID=A0A2P8FHT2_9RHOB|nr:glycerophosphodiester phosphodiesterase family protein [Shimia abyssi]PSL21256.1 glycerophosphoryl diester phosphodiesterase [Shimia abyssi]
MLHNSFLTVPLAHRALHDVNDGRPENSRAAVRAAVERGYGIEIDLQLSRDGQAMVFHDYQLDRLTAQSGAVRQRNADELAAISLNGGDEGIPTFSEVLDIVGGRVPVLVELKDQDGALGPNIGALEAATAVAARDYAGPLAVMSFNSQSVLKLAEIAPDIPRGITTESYPAEDWLLVPEEVRARMREIPDYDRVGACFISHEAADLGRDRVAELKTAGAKVLCWTIRSEAEEAEARKVADNVTFEGYLAQFS